MSMMDDIDKYSAIWDDAQNKDIFKSADNKAKKEKQKEEEESFFGSDFFGQSYYNGDDEDSALNESRKALFSADAKYWNQVSNLTETSEYVDPLKLVENKEKGTLELVESDKKEDKEPVKDQDVKVTQNWGVGGKEYFQLEELKVRLEKLESKLNAKESESDKQDSDSQSKIDELKKQIDELSDSMCEKE